MTDSTPSGPARPDRRDAVSASFRRQLRPELAWMRDAGIVPASTAAEIARLYGVDAIGAEGSQKLAWAVFLVGVLLIGCGVVALVAWHWEQMSQTRQLLIIVGAMLGAHASGYMLWFHGNRPRLGHALVLLGTLLFFANIGLVAQIFHVSSDGRSGFLALAVGAAVVALALDSVPNFLVAVLGLAAWSLHDFTRVHSADAWSGPLAVATALVTARLVRRTGSTHALRAGWLAATLLAGKALDHLLPGLRGESLFLVATLTSGAAAAALSARLKPSAHDLPSPERRDLAATLESLAALLLAVAAFVGGFLDFHRAFTAAEPVAWMTWSAGLAVCLASVAYTLARALRASSPAATSAGLLPLGLSFAALAASAGLPAPLPAAFASNVALLVIGGSFAVHGVREERRGRYWSGTALVLATVLARFFEYEANLWLKAAAFIACGVVVLVSGVLYERRIGQASAPAPVAGERLP